MRGQVPGLYQHPGETEPQMPTAVTSSGTFLPWPLPASQCPPGPLKPASGSPPFCQGPAKRVSTRLELVHNHLVSSLLY